MLPPPITRQTWTPRSIPAFTSAAIRATVLASRPNSPGPINTSPEIFSRTRPYFADPGDDFSLFVVFVTAMESVLEAASRAALVYTSRGLTSQLRCDFGGEVLFL